MLGSLGRFDLDIEQNEVPRLAAATRHETDERHATGESPRERTRVLTAKVIWSADLGREREQVVPARRGRRDGRRHPARGAAVLTATAPMLPLGFRTIAPSLVISITIGPGAVVEGCSIVILYSPRLSLATRL